MQKGTNNCKDLYCYTNSKEVSQAFFALKERDQACKSERTELKKIQDTQIEAATAKPKEKAEKALPGGAKAGTNSDGSSKTADKAASGAAASASMMPLPAALLLTLP